MSRRSRTSRLHSAPWAPVVAVGLVVAVGMAAATASRPASALGATPPPAAVRAATTPAFEAAGWEALAGGSASTAVLAATSGATLPTAAHPTTTTTVVPIQNRLPAPAVTLPLTTRQASTRLNPWLAKLSLAGFALFLLLLVIQFVLTGPLRRGRWTL